MSAMGAEVSTRDAPANETPQALTKQHGDWLVRISKQWLHKQGCTKDCRRLSGFSRHGRTSRTSASFCRCHEMEASARDFCGLRRSDVSIRSKRAVLPVQQKRDPSKHQTAVNIWYATRLCHEPCKVGATHPVAYSESETARLYNTSLFHLHCTATQQLCSRGRPSWSMHIRPGTTWCSSRRYVRSSRIQLGRKRFHAATLTRFGAFRHLNTRTPKD